MKNEDRNNMKQEVIKEEGIYRERNRMAREGSNGAEQLNKKAG